MKVAAVTVGIPVRDLASATAWYQTALGLSAPDLVPAPGIVEFDLGALWLQLAHSPDTAGGAGISLNLSVGDVRSERTRLQSLGLEVTEIQRFEGAVEVFDLTDPDGNTIGFVTELV